MGRSIVKQPDGRFAIFSSIVDNFTYVNLTDEEVNLAIARDRRSSTEQDIASAVRNKKAGHRSWEDLLKSIKSQYGQKEFDTLMDEIKNSDEPLGNFEKCKCGCEEFKLGVHTVCAKCGKQLYETYSYKDD